MTVLLAVWSELLMWVVGLSLLVESLPRSVLALSSPDKYIVPYKNRFVNTFLKENKKYFFKKVLDFAQAIWYYILVKRFRDIERRAV